MKANLLVTTSVDQRLNLWSYESGVKETMLKLTSSFTHDVADVASTELLRNRLVVQVQPKCNAVVTSLLFFEPV